jgi:diguanylate cyclase (GGDEF)-like protein
VGREDERGLIWPATIGTTLAIITALIYYAEPRGLPLSPACLYLIPIGLAAYQYGVRVGLSVALLAVFLFFSLFVRTISQTSPSAGAIEPASLLLLLPLFSLLMSYLADYKQRYHELHLTHERLRELFEKTLNMDELLPLILSHSLGACDARGGEIFLKDESGRLEAVASQGVCSALHAGDDGSGAGQVQSLADWLLAHDSPMIVSDLVSDPRFESRGAESLLVAPLRREGEAFGFIVLTRAKLFSKRDLTILEAIAGISQIAIEKARLYEHTKHLAITDDLTRLYNRRHFYQELEREIIRSERYGYPFSLLIFDIDDFKKYNDTYGHLAGDSVLRELSAIVKEIIRQSDIIARYGGEEFAIILPETGRREAIYTAERLWAAVRAHPFPIREAQLVDYITISVGVAVYPQDAQNVDGLIHAADMALYVAKRTKDAFHAF